QRARSNKPPDGVGRGGSVHKVPYRRNAAGRGKAARAGWARGEKVQMRALSQARNPKHETRNNTEIPKRKCRNGSFAPFAPKPVSSFLFLGFGACFGFSTSCFGLPARPAVLRI